jgi:hypothetical protein
VRKKTATKKNQKTNPGMFDIGEKKYSKQCVNRVRGKSLNGYRKQCELEEKNDGEKNVTTNGTHREKTSSDV